MSNISPFTAVSILAIAQEVPDFALPDHTRATRSLASLTGAEGLLLGFIGEIWKPANVTRILNMQRHAPRFAELGVPVALVVSDRVGALANFMLSSPLPVTFPLLADPDKAVQTDFRMLETTGLLLIDHGHVLRYKWLNSGDTLWPSLNDVLNAAADSIRARSLL